ncbi:alpha/beta fold hydrolase [soil metagenome]
MAADSNVELLQSGKADFKLQVPYQVLETGKAGKQKPLIVYLHGYGQTIKSFREDCTELLTAEAFHLFIQAPYPLYDQSRKKKVSEWGRAWYLFDGDQEQFRTSLDHASRFIREIITRVKEVVDASRICLIGFSMGGYLAGYHAIHCSEQVNEVIIYGARFKSELLIGDYQKISHQNILALHGKADKKVEPGPQQAEILTLRRNGVNATFMEIDEAHDISQSGIKKILEWLKNKGYTCMSNITFS